MIAWVRHFVLSLLALFGLAHPNGAVYQGYGEGDYVLVAPQIGGTIDALNVARGDTVQQGYLLFTLEHAAEQAAVDQARAARTEAAAADRNAAVVVKRDRLQIAAAAISQATLDADIAALDEADARLAQVQAALAQAQWKLDQKTVRAPTDARVFDTLYRAGETVSAGQPVLSLLPPGNIRARFFVPGTALATLSIGQTVTISETGADQPITAHIAYIAPQAEYSPPELYNRDNRQKLLYMLEATPDATPERIHPGQPLDVTVPAAP